MAIFAVSPWIWLARCAQRASMLRKLVKLLAKSAGLANTPTSKGQQTARPVQMVSTHLELELQRVILAASADTMMAHFQGLGVGGAYLAVTLSSHHRQLARFAGPVFSDLPVDWLQSTVGKRLSGIFRLHGLWISLS